MPQPHGGGKNSTRDPTRPKKRRFYLQREDGRHALKAVEATRRLNKQTVLGRYNIPDGNRHRRFGKTRLMPLIHGSWKIKTNPMPRGQQIAHYYRKQLVLFFRSENQGRVLFLAFRLLDRIAHMAGVLSVESLLGGHQ